ncbi:penicillin-binding transpeptidase domain-containing protein [Zhenhengia yiwuensis]|uniref:penicillin-binding transpeptidase domain-containing protein n=1 Tax=Zhenhengia yiwuensis TaxID=2763666 RepID=UPI001D54E22F|nr:penicillin-binding transpeptidase domain-containing protein [Zhenhengia yiwuensis]MBU3810242.1 penicillin-binding transpeptidase domain-containing protein [Candidatus Niameybacter stercoravium]MDY3368052.1 penicillin-binding transpeptidase domain-containing protein [Zhenhengia yiwuensis]
MFEKKKNKKGIKYFGILIGLIVCILGLYKLIIFLNQDIMQPDEVLQLYTTYINEQKYEEMYALLDDSSQEITSQEDFISKNKNIYEGIEARDITVHITEVIKQSNKQTLVKYDTDMDTLAGEISFSNQAIFTKNKDREYKLKWYSQLIFPQLNPKDKVRVNTLKADRGTIYDRNREMLAGKGIASSIGIVPGKMSENREEDIEKIAELLEVSTQSIYKKLEASYVKDDTFVPIKTIKAGQEELEEALLKVKGIKITNTPVRVYPLEEKIAHLVGYIQKVNAEDLERLEGEGYNANSVIGRAGLEKIYEEELRGIDGYEIIIVDSENNKKQTLAEKRERDGRDIVLTIDSRMQSHLYDQFADDKSCSVVMNPKTGEILALVSTPSFDSNDFVLGMPTVKWEMLNNDVNLPLYNRFKAILAPGSGFKSVIAAIGLTTGKLDPNDNYGNSGRSWQKDSSWGGYKVTTLKDYGDEVVLRNALIYSDNIYFAKVALNIGAETLKEQLIKIGFGETIPFEVGVYASSFSNTETFNSEIQLADSGYGQGQILVNPIHMASIYSAFVNEGSMIKPYLIYGMTPEYWKEQVFTKEAAEIVRNDLIQVVEKAGGGIAKVEGITLAGKTGTAEIKQSKDDQEGTELGWFNVFTADPNSENPLLVISMVEDVKHRGGAGYVIPKVKSVFKDTIYSY